MYNVAEIAPITHGRIKVNKDASLDHLLGYLDELDYHNNDSEYEKISESADDDDDDEFMSVNRKQALNNQTHNFNNIPFDYGALEDLHQYHGKKSTMAHDSPSKMEPPMNIWRKGLSSQHMNYRKK